MIKRTTGMRISGLALAAIAMSLSLGACATMGKGGDKTTTSSGDVTPAQADQDEKIPLSQFFGFKPGETAPTSKKSMAYNEQSGIGVNAYLWRASLDTISFMPLASADPWGGTIISDWYANPQKPDERFKTTIYILDSRLRADALNVSVYKQVNQGGQWVDADVSEQTQLDIENAILTRARELRLSNVKN